MAAPQTEAPTESTERARRAFLLRVAELLHAYGTPAYRLERVLTKVARTLGEDASFLSTPTSVFASFGEEGAKEAHLLRGESGEVNLGKLSDFDEVLEAVEAGTLTPAQGHASLDRVAAAPSRHPAPIAALGHGLAAAGAATFFGGGPAEVIVTFVLALGLYLLGRILPREPDVVGIYEPLAAFLVAFCALGLASTRLTLDDRIVSLASLIVLLPGLSLTTGFTELATRHLVSGVARIAGATAVFLTLLFGVALAWRLGPLVFGVSQGAEPVATPLPGWALWVAALVSPIAFGVLLEARRRDLGVVFAAGFAGYLAARGGHLTLGSDLGPFLGALVVGLCSNAYARLSNRPALVPMTPGLLFLVPGSLGFRSLTSFLEEDSITGMSWAFETGLVAIALVGGLLAANVALPPRRVL